MHSESIFGKLKFTLNVTLLYCLVIVVLVMLLLILVYRMRRRIRSLNTGVKVASAAYRKKAKNSSGQESDHGNYND